MLFIEKSKNNGGFVLWGDYWTLRELHTLCMDAAEKSPTLNHEGLTVSLAYDLRKAYEKQREMDTASHFDEEIKIYGVEQIWPTFIVQLALLRTALAFYDSTKLEQSLMYRLEHLFAEAVPEIFPKQSRNVLMAFTRLAGIQEQQVEGLLGSRVSYFLSLTKAKRASELANVMRSLDSVMDSFLRDHPHHRENSFDPTVFDGHSWDTITHNTKL
ncbi:DUF6904 family protein [Pseudoalteromonas galatheae]|uniref:DUF6904 family protein n=1 Tax=Pseudoalteromonas galatheae TaxID=579562 RepID=UPI0030CCFE2D